MNVFFRALPYFLVSFFLALIITPVAKRVGFFLKIYAVENKRTVHHGHIVRIGGMAIFLAYIVTMAVFMRAGSTLNAIMIGSLIIFIGGFIDDMFDLRPIVKLLFEIVAALYVIFFGGIALLTTGGGSRSGHRKRTAGEQFTPQNLLKPVKDYVSLDPSFDEAAFCAYLKNLYERMQVSWHFRDLTDLKEALTTDFYNRSDRQLADKRVSGEIPVTEEVDVRQVSVLGYYQVGQDDHMVVMIRAALIAYYVNEQTGKLLRGDRKNKKLMTYEWDLVRKTEAHSEGWRLDNIKGISQQTLKES